MSEREVLNKSKYAPIIARMVANSTGAPIVTEENVYQMGKPANKPLVQEIVRDLLEPGSRIIGKENLLELQYLAFKKKPCLILMEHYSNFDLPCFCELLDAAGGPYPDVSDAIVAVAGVKLNEESPLVLAFTEVFTRVVLYPSRGIESIEDPKARHDAEKRRAKINIAALKRLTSLRKEGKLILVFPSGNALPPLGPVHGARPQGDRYLPEVLFPHGAGRHQREHAPAEPGREHGRGLPHARRDDLHGEPRAEVLRVPPARAERQGARGRSQAARCRFRHGSAPRHPRPHREGPAAPPGPERRAS